MIRKLYERFDEYGRLHCDDGPAREWSNGTKAWFQNDKLHRVDGPAVECVNKENVWYQNGVWHRYYGPAVESHWYINGTCII